MTRAAKFIDRELSWLDFNSRVLSIAEDPETPLLERLKFLAIFTTNLDEFFEIRVAGILEQVAAGVRRQALGGMYPKAQLRAIRSGARPWPTRNAPIGPAPWASTRRERHLRKED